MQQGSHRTQCSQVSPDDNEPSFKMIKDVFNNMMSFNISFSAYIGFCFNDRVLGIWQGGSGMALTGEEPFVPNCGAQVAASDMAQCDADGIKCRDCAEIKPCTDCQYWPLYPCYSPVRPMAHCIAEYTNDPIAVGQADPINYSTGLYMYERSVQEGHDARLFRFTPTDDTVSGSHQDPKNLEYWKVGCLGLTEPCTATCEASFLDCVASQGATTYLGNTEAFETCIDSSKFKNLDGCTDTCAPTYGMLESSEKPEIVAFDNFGAGPEEAADQPTGSMCSQ